MKNRIIYVSLGCLLLLGGMLLLLTSPRSSAQVSDNNTQIENECREILNGFYLRSKNQPGLIKAYGFSDDPIVERLVYELRLDMLKSLLSKEPSVCYDLDSLEKILMGEVKPIPTPMPTPPKMIATNVTPSPMPSPTITPTPTPLPTKTPFDANLILNPNSPPIKFTPEERAERWKKIKKLLDKLFPETGEIENWIRKIKEKNKLPEPPKHVKIRDEGGWQIDSFFDIFIEVDAGNIRLKIPKDIRPGDIITGTVTAEPKGKTEEEKKKNEEELKKYGLEIVCTPPSGSAFPKGVTTVSPTATTHPPAVWRAPGIDSWFSFYNERPVEPLPAGYQIPINVAVTKNDPQTNIPIELVQLSLVSVQPINVNYSGKSDSPWQMPQFVQIGNPVEIQGKFDGIADTTTLQIDGKPLEIIAESPRSCFFTTKPSEVGALAYAQGNDIHLGSGEMTVKEGDNQQKLPFRVVGVGLSAPKLNLLRGEKTTVTVQVSGLKDLLETEIVPLQLVSNGVINMAGGDSQSLQIRKKDVDKDGVYRTTREVTGHSSGGWGVTATVIDPRRRPIFIPLIPNSKGNGYRSEKRNSENLFTAFEVRHPLTGKLLEGEHKLETGCQNPTLAKIPMMSLLFKNGNSERKKTDCLLFVTPRIIIADEP